MGRPREFYGQRVTTGRSRAALRSALEGTYAQVRGGVEGEEGRADEDITRDEGGGASEVLHRVMRNVRDSRVVRKLNPWRTRESAGQSVFLGGNARDQNGHGV